jgi:RNA polymerase sigma-70 factor, ECF subfamily
MPFLCGPRRWRPPTARAEPDTCPEVRPPLARLRSELLQQAARALADLDEAEDACQEALVRTWRAVTDGRCPREKCAPFGQAVLRNVLLEMWRTRRRATAPWEPPRGLASDPLAELLQDETRASVQRAIASLPPQQREVASLSLLHGLSCAEVSRRLGLDAATTRQRKHRAIQRLRVALGVAGHDGEAAPAGAGLDRSTTLLAGSRATEPCR